jgi:hypothetical protein
METTPEDYREQIEDWKETVCELTFGDTPSKSQHHAIPAKKPSPA